MNGKALNLRNVPPDLIVALHEKAAAEKMHLRDYCLMLLEKGVNGKHPIDSVTASDLETVCAKDKPTTEPFVPWVGGNRDIDPSNPEDVAAWLERDRQAAAMLSPAPPEMNPVMFQVAEAVKKDIDKMSGAEPAAEPAKRFPKDVPLLCTKCKKMPMRARDETTWRCPMCGHQEPR